MELAQAPRFSRRIAPLNPLRAFEAAARHLSFTQAAEELCVTQGAVSRSVKALEDYMGEPLFERGRAGLMLSERSGILAHRLTEVFDRLNDATDEFRGLKQLKVLTVRTYTSFMIGFLIPKLIEFQVLHPKIKVRLVSATDSAELGSSLSDVRIRYGRGHWRGVDSTLLFHDQLRPICSPRLLDPAKRPYPVEVLREHVLLHQELRRPDWPDWIGRTTGQTIVARDNLMFEESSVAYHAAISGVGIGIAQKAYFRQEITDGQLFEPFEGVLHRDLGYYLTIPNDRRDSPQVSAFRTWLVEAFKAMEIEDHGLAAGRMDPPQGQRLSALPS
jgi:DNA-binding transcriptional LysR family regulator